MGPHAHDRRRMSMFGTVGDIEFSKDRAVQEMTGYEDLRIQQYNAI